MKIFKLKDFIVMYVESRYEVWDGDKKIYECFTEKKLLRKIEKL